MARSPYAQHDRLLYARHFACLPALPRSLTRPQLLTR
jgi:hypothetical protein